MVLMMDGRSRCRTLAHLHPESRRTFLHFSTGDLLPDHEVIDEYESEYLYLYIYTSEVASPFSAMMIKRN